MKYRDVFDRLYSAYLLPSRMAEYGAMIDAALARGYEHITVTDFYRLIVSGQQLRGKKYFIHRHDIDTDTRGARRFFEIEQTRGVAATYYFRLSTIDYALMRAINTRGGEASYHFEELASYCKRHKIKSSEQAMSRLDAIRPEFVKNFRDIEARVGYKLRSVASHGDFVNRALGLKNSILVDEKIRGELGIEVEAYDPPLVDAYSIAMSDAPYPKMYRTFSPFRALEDGHAVIYLLTHPNHWNVNVMSSTRELAQRIYEGLRYRG